MLRSGADVVDIITDMANLDQYSGLVLPGVGNFDPAIVSVSKHASSLDSAIRSGMPILGICLGMEMLFERSEEGKLDGLSIVEGDVVLLPREKVKIPHMGWNNLRLKDRAGGSSRFLKGVKDGSWVYFVHSFLTRPKRRGLVSATSQYGTTVPAVIEEGNLIGVQFHPEKSAESGSIMLRNFVKMGKDWKK